MKIEAAELWKRLRYLLLIREHPGKMGWYQLDRALRGGSITLDDMMDVLSRLQSEGFIRAERGEGDTMDRYWITDKGSEFLEERRRQVLTEEQRRPPNQ